jgi:hypothetical protein
LKETSKQAKFFSLGEWGDLFTRNDGGMDESKILRSLVGFQPVNLEPPDAWIGHTPFAYWLIQKLQPSVFVELGVHTGNSYFSFCQSIQENRIKTDAYAVDTWNGDEHAGLYDESVFEGILEANKKYESFSSLLRTTFSEAAASFEENSIGLLHIDGLHTYEAVKNDFETWLTKMSSDGVILFHDTNVHRDGFGVYRFWSEISERYHSMEFFHSNGLGVIDLSRGTSLIIPSEIDDANEMVEFFANLGDNVSTRFHLDHARVELDEKNRELEGVNQQNRDLRSLVEALQGSGSWKLTAPLRFIWRLILRLMSRARIVKMNSDG